MPRHAQNIMTFRLTHVCMHVNQPLFQVPMRREALRRATDPNHRVPTGYRRRWDGSNASQIAEHVLVHLHAGIRQPASCGSILGTLQATLPDPLWRPRGWRGACGSHSVQACHSERSPRSATARLPAKTWHSMWLCSHSLNCISPFFRIMEVIGWDWLSDMMTLTTQHRWLSPAGKLPCPPHHWACSAVSHSCNVAFLGASALTSISHTVFTIASNDVSVSMLCCLLYDGRPLGSSVPTNWAPWTQSGVWLDFTSSLTRWLTG